MEGETSCMIEIKWTAQFGILIPDWPKCSRVPTHGTFLLPGCLMHINCSYAFYWWCFVFNFGSLQLVWFCLEC